ncbi:MAG: hypothetical protein K5990_04635, partial [Oscillospiraceae bacterium]|nr:hypothetical protein [Oscillospiraceae bacterium]
MPEGYERKGISYSVPETNGTHVVKAEAVNRAVVVNQPPAEPEMPPLRIVIDKFESGDNSQKLSGATFVLYRFPSPEELNADPALSAETPLYYTRAEDSAPPMFRPDLARALAVTTDADGHAEFSELSDGDYYLLETEAPVDYRKLIAPIAVTVDTSWLETAENPTQAQIAAASVFTVHIANTSKTTLPATGGPGPARQAGLAPLLLGVGAAGLVILRRKRKTAGR